MIYTPHTCKVFVNENNSFGDPVSLVVDEGRLMSLEERLRITGEIGNVETAFVNDLATNDVSIYHAQGEVDFAGSVLIGVAWQLARLKSEPTQQILCKRGTVKTEEENGVYWVQTEVSNNIGNWDYEQNENPEAVNAIHLKDTTGWKKMVWAWINEEQGYIRARTFADKIGMREVQGNGSGSMNLAVQLHRSITLIHGEGSIIYARPLSDNLAEVGGRVSAA